MTGMGLKLAAPAKVNLFLSVGRRRDDGFHDVSTVLTALSLHDTVTVTPAAGFSFVCEPEIAVFPERNLACAAAVALSSSLERPLAVALRVVKRLPVGGGLGGGSSDAAAVILGLCSLWEVDPHSAVVRAVAARLGADVPFFLTGGTGLYKSRGDELVARMPTPEADIVVVDVGEPVSTAAVYAALDVAPSQVTEATGMVEALQAGDLALIGSRLRNDLSAASCGLLPSIADALGMLGSSPGVLGAAMAGSGSCVFAIAESEDAAKAVADRATVRGWRAWVTRTSPLGAVVTGDGDGGGE
ncbi:MAG: 4-(cytidine 5'-diphospho)-2-C-methyl-D-erythritol kinase [Coriobacteriia bacterium]